MKKLCKSFLLFVLFFVLSNPLIAKDSEYAINVDNKYCGTYLPVSVIDYFEETLDFETAKRKVPRISHDVLAVNKDICYSAVQYGERYAIEKEDFKHYVFQEKGKDLYLFDNKGNKYKRISLIPHCYNSVADYVAEHLFYCIKDLKNVEVRGREVIIKGKGSYTVEVDSNWADSTNCLTFLNYCKSAVYSNGLSGGFYETENDEELVNYRKLSNKEIIHFPFLTYKPLRPLEELSVEELRLYRNLQFAVHGYKFKSKDLQDIFSQFEWYKLKASNDGIKLTKEEQSIVDKCLELEAIKPYLDNFFKGMEYKYETMFINNEQCYYAYHRVDENKKLDDKAIIFRFTNNKVSPMLIIDGLKIGNGRDEDFTCVLPSSYEFYGWKIFINNKKSNRLYITNYSNKGKIETDSIMFELNDKGYFNQYQIPSSDL